MVHYTTQMSIALDVEGFLRYFPVEVSYIHHPRTYGKREPGTNIPLEPDEAASVEIVSVVGKGELSGLVLYSFTANLLSPEQIKCFSEMILDDLEIDS